MPTFVKRDSQGESCSVSGYHNSTTHEKYLHKEIQSASLRGEQSKLMVSKDWKEGGER